MPTSEGALARNFPWTRFRGRSPRIPTLVRLGDIVSGWTLGVTIFAVVKTVFGASWNAERCTKAIALDIGAAAKWARMKFDVTHVSRSAMFAGEADIQSIDNRRRPASRRRVHEFSLTPDHLKSKHFASPNGA